MITTAMLEQAERCRAFIVQAHPTLTYAGWTFRDRRAYPTEVAQVRANYKMRLDLLANDTLQQIATAIAFIDRCQIIMTPSLGSYHLKHVVERWGAAVGFSPYVANGSFIAAALYRVVPIKQYHTGPNCLVALSSKSVEALTRDTQQLEAANNAEPGIRVHGLRGAGGVVRQDGSRQ